MIRAFLWPAALLLSAAGSQAPAGAARPSPPAGKTARLEHMDYYLARRIILDRGWRPAAGPCEQVSKETCGRFPEIDACSGVAPGYCNMLFFKQHRCLYLITSGGAPEGDWEGDTHVENVTFRRGPCSKN
jgi:hypothetical protein